MELRPYAAARASALLEALEKQFERAARAPGPNNVHDLRVAIRRFSQCLRVFAPLLPARRAKRLRRRLRRVMALAGETRSRDIAVKLWKRAGYSADVAWVAKMKHARKRASEKMVKRLARLRRRDFARKCETLWEHPNADAAATGPDLSALAADYLQAAADLLDGQSSAKVLHKFRLITKRVRYTLELFRPGCGPGLELRLQALRRVQQYLGEINDYATTRGLVPGQEAAPFRHFLESRANARTAELLRYLRRWVVAPERRRWWVGYLGGIEKWRN